MNRADAIGHLALSKHWLDSALRSDTMDAKHHHELLVLEQVSDVLKYLENLRDVAERENLP